MSQDSSSSFFWDVRYQQEQTPWESTGLPDGFGTFAKSVLAGQAQRILIPGCGSAAELTTLLAGGHDVRAIDFSAEAIARASQRLPADAAARLQLADFFELPRRADFDWVYERAFLCALPPVKWRAYADVMASLIRPGGCLAGYFFLRPTFRGPPFGMDLASLQELFSPSFTLVSSQQVSCPLPVFAPDEFWLCWQRS